MAYHQTGNKPLSESMINKLWLFASPRLNELKCLTFSNQHYMSMKNDIQNKHIIM